MKKNESRSHNFEKSHHDSCTQKYRTLKIQDEPELLAWAGLMYVRVTRYVALD